MDRHRYQQVKSILGEALDTPPSERAALLSRLCGADAELRAEVESLLEHERDDEFLEPVIRTTEEPAPHGGFSLHQVDPLLDQTFSHYRVKQRLGGGGMGVVYLGEDLRLGRPVALKFLRPDLGLDESAKARFFREARAGAALDHPNICTVYGIEETPSGQLFLAMAYYDGETLKQQLARGPLPLGRALDIARQIARGLEAAHAAGVVHRDVKPGNVMLTGTAVKVLDFGIAKLKDQATLTIPGSKLGTAAYISPEQAEGGRIDHRTDIWSLGAVLYEMLASRRPYEVEHLSTLALAARTVAPEPLRTLRPDVPTEVEVAVTKALMAEPADRFQTMCDFAEALERASQALVAGTFGESAHEALLLEAAEIRASVERVAIRCEPRDAADLARARQTLVNARSAGRPAPEAEFAAAEIAYRIDGNPADAEAALLRGLAARPGDTRARARLAECQLALGDTHAAIGTAKDLLAGDFPDPHTLSRCGRVLFLARAYAEGVRAFSTRAEQTPDSAVAQFDLAIALVHCADPARAAIATERGVSLPEGESLMTAVLGNAARARGDSAAHERARQRLAALGASPLSPCCAVLLDARFGDTGQPLEYLAPLDRAVGLAGFLSLTSVSGSLTALLEPLGLLVYLGVDPSLTILAGVPGVQRVAGHLQISW